MGRLYVTISDIALLQQRGPIEASFAQKGNLPHRRMSANAMSSIPAPIFR